MRRNFNNNIALLNIIWRGQVLFDSSDTYTFRRVTKGIFKVTGTSYDLVNRMRSSRRTRVLCEKNVTGEEKKNLRRLLRAGRQGDGTTWRCRCLRRTVGCRAAWRVHCARGTRVVRAIRPATARRTSGAPATEQEIPRMVYCTFLISKRIRRAEGCVVLPDGVATPPRPRAQTTRVVHTYYMCSISTGAAEKLYSRSAHVPENTRARRRVAV